MSKNYPKDKPSRHATVRIPKEMVDTIEEFLKTDQARKMGFLHITDIATEAVREFLNDLGYYPSRPRFQHYNVYEDRVTIIDNDAPKGKEWVDVWFRGDKPFCEYCQESDCDHIQFILEIPEVVQGLREHGWTLEDGKISRK